ncbi:MAG: GNAT family N-acetyltransferase [Nanoarchaeota archaeon]
MGIKIKEINISDRLTLKKASFLISEYSWGNNYPIKPIDELSKAEYCAGAYSNKKLVGFAAISRFASPDGKDNGKLWLGYSIVIPEFRRQGIFQKLYDFRMKWAKEKLEPLFTCTDNPIIERFLLSHEWHLIRETRDESGAVCNVFEHK